MRERWVEVLNCNLISCYGVNGLNLGESVRVGENRTSRLVFLSVTNSLSLGYTKLGDLPSPTRTKLAVFKFAINVLCCSQSWHTGACVSGKVKDGVLRRGEEQANFSGWILNDIVMTIDDDWCFELWRLINKNQDNYSLVVSVFGKPLLFLYIQNIPMMLFNPSAWFP